EREAAILRRALADARRASDARTTSSGLPATAVACGGPGPQGVARAWGMTHAGSGRPRLVLSFGLAGGLVPGLHAGDACWPAEVLSEAGEVRPTATLPKGSAVRFGIRCGGRLLSCSQPLADRRAKAFSHADHGAQLVDMESYALAEIAARREIPFAVLRVIADEAGDRLQAAVTEATDTAGRVHPVRLVTKLARTPGDWRDFARLARVGRRAEAALGRVGAALPEILLPLLG
ncbi:MAG: hypothetical protein D6757_08030, partial [Alphaproteobacteria bacterium]